MSESAPAGRGGAAVQGARGASGPPAAPPAREVVPLRHHRDFRRYWVARQVSIAGTLVTAVALPVLVYRLSGSPSLTALITVVEGVPYLLFGLFSGALSDRLDRRRVMVVADVVAGLTIASVPIAFALGSLTAVHALVAGFLTQTAFVFFDGAAFGGATRHRRARPDRLGQLGLWGFGALLDLGVPMLAGVMLAVVHPATLLGIDALSFLLSAACVASIRTRLSPERSDVPPLRPRVLLAEVGVGLRFLWGHAGVRSQTIVGFLLSLSGAGFMALSVPYADRLLDVRHQRLAIRAGLRGLGCRRHPRRRVAPHGCSVHLAEPAGADLAAGGGVAGVVVAMTSTWQVAVAVMVVWGVSYQGVLLNSMTYRQQVTPEPLLGRVNTAGRMLSFGVGWTCGALGASALAGLVGLRAALVAVVAVGLVATVFGWLSPLRTIDAHGPAVVAA